MTFKVGDYVCSKGDVPPETARIYQIVEIRLNVPKKPRSVECYGILDYTCNPPPRWGSFSCTTSTDNLQHVSELMILARAGRGEHATGRPQHYVNRGVWSKEAYELAVSSR